MPMQCLSDTSSAPPDVSSESDRCRIAPAIGRHFRRLLDQPTTLQELVLSLGSPLNLVLPDQVIANAQPFLRTFDHYGVEGRLFFTSKPNRSNAIIREVACSQELGVDVSSEGSLAAALSAGVSPSRIEATGPKDIGYITLAILQGIVISVDDVGELRTVIELRRALSLRESTKILVRLSGFKTPRGSFVISDGTFGVTPDQIGDLFEILDLHRDSIDLIGFSYHLYTDSLEYRLVALEQTLEILFAARQRGFSPRVVNIGGGFRIRYAQHPSEWESFILRLKGSVAGQSPICTWNRGGLGFRSEQGQIKGVPRFTDHIEPLPPADQLCNLLKQELSSFAGISAGQLLSESLLELWIEPGRGLLDQVGITIGEVSKVRTSEQGHPLLVMRMNRSHLNTFELTLLTDPLLLPRTPGRKASEIGYFITGSLCVSNELLTPRMIHFGREVQPGDLLVFANTAPYVMDFSESHTLHHPVARKVAGWFRDDAFAWSLDDEYRPLRRRIP